jgi:hypothetical protein
MRSSGVVGAFVRTVRVPVTGPTCDGMYTSRISALLPVAADDVSTSIRRPARDRPPPRSTVPTCKGLAPAFSMEM